MPPRTLLLMRHAKSSWDDPSQTDHDRPLNARGLSDAPSMGRLLLEQGLLPDHVVCSTAERAHATARLVLAALGSSLEPVTTRDLYEADVSQIARVLARCPVSAERVLVVAHNPGLEEAVGALSGEHERLTTANVAVIELAAADWASLESWEHRSGPPGRLKRVYRPKGGGD